jgi:hypothetical protein
MFSAVIYTPGRTGSKLIERNLIDHFSSLHRSWQNKKLFDSGIVHCHNPLYVPPNKNFICIISTRRNEFDAILSMITTKQTKEFATYTNKTIEPFEVSETEFKSMFYYYTCFYEIINRSFFDSVVEMEYESLISNPKYLFSKLGIDQVTNYKKIKKSPYDYHSLITNVNELKKLYLEMKSTPLTQEDINQVKNNIELDLHNLRVYGIVF